MISIQEAKKHIHTSFFVPEKIFVNLENSLNYFLAEDICADRDYPPFNRAAVDGYAVRFSDIDAGKKKFHIAAEIFPGERFDQVVENGRCVKIMTGSAVPHDFDVLFKVEHCEAIDNVVTIPEKEIGRGLNISQRGENIKKGEIIVRKGTRIDERTVHSLAATGLHSVPVFSLPEIHIISTGNEVVSVNQQPSEFQIRDSNYFGLLFQLARFNIKPKSRQLLGDEKEEIRNGISASLDGDILIISGGVSMGDRDFVPEILNELGVTKIFHHVNVKPGKPLWFGHRKSKDTNKYVFVFALPGNPFSTIVSYKIFIEPWLYACFQNNGQKHFFLPMEHDKIIKTDRPEYIPAKIISKPDQTSSLEILKFHGSGDITATSGSDGLVFVSNEKSSLQKGDAVEFIPWN